MTGNVTPECDIGHLGFDGVGDPFGMFGMPCAWSISATGGVASAAQPQIPPRDLNWSSEGRCGAPRQSRLR